MNNEQLQALLRRWRDIEPAGNFEANVRRRIRLAATDPRQSWVIELLWRPAFGVAAAILISAVIGSSGGILSSRHHTGRAEMQFMSGGTLAGGYVRLATEVHR